MISALLRRWASPIHGIGRSMFLAGWRQLVVVSGAAMFLLQADLQPMRFETTSRSWLLKYKKIRDRRDAFHSQSRRALVSPEAHCCVYFGGVGFLLGSASRPRKSLS